MKNDPIETALAKVDGATSAELAKFLSSKWSLVVAKAARVAGERHATELLPDLVAAFDRVLAAQDKGCAALTAVARALVILEHDDPEVFRRGLKHVHMEATWGGRTDVAAELRASCAIGLANTRDPKRLRDLVDLLADSMWQARAGAARAIAAVGGDPAVLLLRFKILTGDEHDDVLYECFAGLIELEGAEVFPLIRDVKSEPAILALGASRRGDAVSLLKQLYAETRDPARLNCILLALASSKLDYAIEFILDQIRTASDSVAKMATDAISIHRGDPRIAQAIESAAMARA